jgi:hypothetical protein
VNPSVNADGKPPSASLAIESRRDWFGDQRLGTFTVSVDRRNVGKLPPVGRIDVPCEAGSHVVRIGQWWYRSPPLSVAALSGQTIFLKADRSRVPLLRRLAIFAFTPWRALVLTEESNGRA